MENKIEIYKTADNQTEINVHFDADTVWLSQLQMSELFGRDRTVITRHIGNIFKDNELDKKSGMCKICTYHSTWGYKRQRAGIRN